MMNMNMADMDIFLMNLLYNRGIDPEQHTVEFYGHYDCMKAMLAEIRGSGLEMQISSDDTLGKNLTFEVYTRRWGHTDRYQIQRTIDGWKCSYIAIGGKCDKNGGNQWELRVNQGDWRIIHLTYPADDNILARDYISRRKYV